MESTGVTVRELLRIPLLKEAKVIGGVEGLDRVVRYIDIMEVPEVNGWLREGELLLTTAYSIRHDPSRLPELVESLAEAKAAALAIKPARFLHDLPAEMISMSDRYHLPIIEIPTGIPFVDITHAVMEQVLDRQAGLLRRAEEVYRTLTTMVLENSGIQAVVDNVAELVKSPVRVIDIYGEMIVSSPLEVVWEEGLSWDVIVDKQVVGKLQIAKDRLDEMEQVCVEQARLVVALELMRRKTAFDTESRLRGNFVDELLSDLPPAKHEVERRGLQLGLNPEVHWQVGIAEGKSDAENSAIWARLRQMLDQEAKTRTVRPYVDVRLNRMLLMLPCNQDGKDWADLLETWLKGLNESSNHFYLGLGRSYPLWEVNRSYLEARKALVMGMKLKNGRAVNTYDELEIYQLLTELADHPGFSSLFARHLGKLYAYDKENGADLLRTLYIYLESNGSLTETANRLYIHRNSVKYRLERMKEIAQIDLNDSRQWFVYQLCLICHYLKGDGEV